MSTNRILEFYRHRTQTSAELAAEARQTFPSGVTHDSRYLEPHPIFVERAEGSRKWDVDGNEYVDYFGGHGALLLGHNHPQVTQAVRRQLERGTHYGACHELELRWGQLVQRLMPSAERVRFTSSGTEATLMALRLARAFTGKPKVVRFLTHFHGWQDHVAFGVGSHHDGTPTPGVLAALAENIVLVPPGDAEAVASLLAGRNDIAAVMLEPTGASWGQIPYGADFVRRLRELTARHGVLLFLDEVITGFRCAPGGAQEAYGVRPDLTTLAKILAGGLPGGAVAGRRDILELLDHAACKASGRERIAHHGTFNANPLSASAGLATLEIVANGAACRAANDYAEQLREALLRVVRDERVPWCVYGTFSGFHICVNPNQVPLTDAEQEHGPADWHVTKAAASSPLAAKLRLGMLVHGVELMSWPGGPTSAVHTEDDLERTAEAFRGTIRLLKADGDV